MTNNTVEPIEQADSGKLPDASMEIQSVASDLAQRPSERVSVPDFAPLNSGPNSLSQPSVEADIHRLHEVEVTVTAELGRTKVPIEKILKLTEGSVFKLNRSIESPVELVAQGVPLGSGEVVVVDGNFAIRIQQIFANQ